LPVVDASAFVEYLLGTDAGVRVAGHLHEVPSFDAPQLIDAEVVSALRRLELEGAVRSLRALEALDDLLLAPIVRYPLRPLLPRIWEVRRTLSAYDASYVALAEALATPLLTTDGRLARAHGHRAETILVA
jgi:predicted nucleic acid-binding protein